MPLSVGTRLGPYEIQAAIGAGGMGEVYRARDTRLDRTVAIKILPEMLAETAESRARFEREARAVSSLSHPHICMLYDIGHQNGISFIVMEYLEGEPLGKRLERGALPVGELLRIGIQIADALDKSHRQGIVHRDLKPGNIMLTKSGAKLLDFGLAKTAAPLGWDVSSSPTASMPLGAAGSGQPLTREGSIVGTFQYMSPEQLEGKEADARSDIFSFGSVLYEMATGKKAFEGKSQASLIAAILEHEPAPIVEARQGLPATLERVVRTCLAKNPEDRFQSAHDLKLQLEWIRDAGSQASSAGVAAPALPRRHANVREMVAWAVAACALLACVAFWLLRSKSEFSELPTYASIVSPAGTSFQLEGDQGAPPALAPDGSAVVFGADNELWYRSLRGGTERMLAGAHGAMFPFWSPDGASIGFFADGKLKTLDLNSGVIRELCEAPGARGGSWGTSGIILISPTVRDVIYQIPAGGGSLTPVTHMDAKLHTTHRWPFFLPDGQHFLYLATNHSNAQAEQNGIYFASLDGKVNRMLVSSLANAAYAEGKLLYVVQSTLYAQPFDPKKGALSGNADPLAEGLVVDLGVWHSTFTASGPNELIYQTGTASAQSRLEWVDREGKHLSYASDKGSFFGMRLSHDGKRMLVATGDPSADLWIYDVAGPNKTRITFDRAVVTEAVWSPDDSRFGVTIGLPNNRFNLITKASGGSGPTTVLQEPESNDAPTDWSPDGRYLLTERFLNGESEIWLRPVNPGEEPRPLLTSDATKGLQASGQFSPDGKFIAFTLATTSVPQVYVVPFPSGNGMWQVTGDGGHWPRWRRDGKELYFITVRNVLNAVEIREKGDSLEVGHPVPLFSFRPSLRTYRAGMIDYDVSPDGKRFLLNTVADENSRPLTLVVNWTAGLGKK